MALILSALVSNGFAAEAPLDLNWLKNGSFSATGAWEGDLRTEAGPHGQAAVLENAQPAWTSLHQSIQLPQPSPPAIELSGWMKAQDVKRGDHDWEIARITVVFYDQAGQRLGDWPAPVAQIEGSRDWAFYSQQYAVPKGSARAEVGLGLEHCTGKAWFSQLEGLVYDYDLKALAPGGVTHPSRQPPAPTAGENWLIDPGFESPGSRDWSNAHVSPGGHGSPHALFTDNAVPAWTEPEQSVPFKGMHPAAVELSGWMRTEGVKTGAESYMQASMGLDFRDEDNAQKGGWQTHAAQANGTTPWTYYEKKYVVPEGSSKVLVNAGLGNCVGQAWFDDLSLKLLDADGKALTTTVVDQQVTDTSDWWAYTPPKEASGTALDLSWLNEKPAGTHGFVQVKDGHLAFADGTRVRFWGTDLVGPNHFMSHADADALARRMAKLGINLVRLHMPDAAWSPENLFDPKSDNTLELDPAQVEKLDYLCYALKSNGIYVYPDWMVARRFRSGDGVKDFEGLEDGAKGAIHFDARLIELNKRYATQLLGHVNPYTKLALKDDPFYVGNEIVNESSIFSGFAEHKFPESYWQELQGLYKAWGGQGEITRFKFDWETQGLLPLKNAENADQSLRFLYAELAKTDLEMKRFQQGLSPHALLAGSNMGLPVLGELRANALLDFMDTHAYWDHPQIWNIEGGWSNVAIAPFNNASQLRAPFQGSLLAGLAQSAVEGKPLLVTEWNDCFPNEYRLEGPLLMAAYGSLQDWDGFLQFDYDPTRPGLKRMSNFSISGRPDNEPLYQAGALIFRLGLLKAAPLTVTEALSDADLTKNGMKSPWLFDSPWLPYAVKVAKRFTGKQAALADPALAEAAKYHRAADKVIDSSSGEESLDYGKGVLSLDAPQAQGFVGRNWDG